ncbi:MAG: hypothetical protein GY914_02515 [Prochlorococcus sp.]|jgi:hypothetical protein|nr:hypothetical protein [Prochlorococcus sp.]MDP6192921.1 hypothetical protein [Prochlorococcaceae cyanobacterium ETNP18_MAG_1]CAI8168582.1 MAG: Uncharacterised protein [Prochlorococcus marinus str. MIT 9215]
MPSPQRFIRPGEGQRRRCAVAVLLALLVWGFRWLWPLQYLPGWIVMLVMVWAALELVGLLWFPRRWR